MRNFTTLRNEKTLENLYKFSKQVATDYACSPASTARSDFMRKYNITESCYYTILEFSVSHSLVSDVIVEKIIKKLTANQRDFNNGYNTRVKYNLLKEDRKNYSAFSKSEILYIAKYFAEHPEESKAEIASRFSFCDTKVLDQVLYRACIECIVTDKVFEQIKAHSLGSTQDLNKTEAFFQKLERKRTELKAARKRTNKEKKEKKDF